MKVLIIDNYDSFTYNLFHYVEPLVKELKVLRNNAFPLEKVNDYDGIILSPGPGLPDEAGLTKEVIDTFKSKKRILGICLGHQAIVESEGGKLKNLDEVLHGIAVETYLLKDNNYIFNNIPENILTGRYHSYVACKKNLPDSLQIIATDVYGEIQAVKHITYDVTGLQFHPESVLTPYGKKIIENWVSGF